VDVEANTTALLALIEQDRARRCGESAITADVAVTQILREARRQGRTRVSAALAHERRRLRDRLAASDAALATAMRLHDQRRFRALLDTARRHLPQALAARWLNDEQRTAWVGHVVTCARDALPAGSWTINHAPGWPADQRNSIAAALAPAGIHVSFAEDSQLDAGLEVRAGGNRIDGTAAGLMADAGEIGARLLDALAANARHGDGAPQ
jgi:hypothetical protein